MRLTGIVAPLFADHDFGDSVVDVTEAELLGGAVLTLSRATAQTRRSHRTHCLGDGAGQSRPSLAPARATCRCALRPIAVQRVQLGPFPDEDLPLLRHLARRKEAANSIRLPMALTAMTPDAASRAPLWSARRLGCASSLGGERSVESFRSDQIDPRPPGNTRPLDQTWSFVDPHSCRGSWAPAVSVAH